MKRLQVFKLFVVLLMISGGFGLISCDKDEPIIDKPLTILDEFNVKDTTGLVCLTHSLTHSDTSLVCLGGTRNGNIWFGVFDNKTKDQVYECSTDIKLKRTVTKDLGYGESVTFVVDEMVMYSVDYQDNKLVSSVSLMNENEYYPLLYTCDGINMYECELEKDLIRYGSPVCWFWYENTVNVNNHNHADYACSLYDLTGKLIRKVDREYLSNNSIIINFSGEPCSLYEFINIGGSNLMKYDLLGDFKDKALWSTNYLETIEGVQQHPRVTTNLQSKNKNIWTYKVDILNKDGSKVNTFFKINIDNGEIIK